MRQPYCYARSDNGSLFGLTSEDLTSDQLNKLQSIKLYEFLESDNRIEDILAVRLSNFKDFATEINLYKYFDKEDWDKFIKIKNSYNQLLNNPQIKSSFDNLYNREDKLFWYAMNDTYRLDEVNRLLAGQTSSVYFSNIDFAWLYSINYNLAKDIAKVALAHQDSYRGENKKNVITNIDGPTLKDLLPEINLLPKDLRLHLLSNPFTPDNCLDDLLRIMAKKSLHQIPKIRCVIKSEVLKKLPPIYAS